MGWLSKCIFLGDIRRFPFIFGLLKVDHLVTLGYYTTPWGAMMLVDLIDALEISQWRCIAHGKRGGVPCSKGVNFVAHVVRSKQYMVAYMGEIHVPLFSGLVGVPHLKWLDFPSLNRFPTLSTYPRTSFLFGPPQDPPPHWKSTVLMGVRGKFKEIFKK